MSDSNVPVCEVSGGPCEFVVEEYYDEEGNLDSWDEYCKNCSRYRDWSKESGPKPDAQVARR